MLRRTFEVSAHYRCLRNRAIEIDIYLLTYLLTYLLVGGNNTSCCGRLRSHCAEDDAGSYYNHRLRSAWHSSDVPLSLQHRQLHGQHFPHVLQARLLRHILLSEVRSRPAAPAAETAPPARDGRTEEHSAWTASGLHRMYSLRSCCRKRRLPWYLFATVRYSTDRGRFQNLGRTNKTPLSSLFLPSSPFLLSLFVPLPSLSFLPFSSLRSPVTGRQMHFGAIFMENSASNDHVFIKCLNHSTICIKVHIGMTFGQKSWDKITVQFCPTPKPGKELSVLAV